MKPDQDGERECVCACERERQRKCVCSSVCVERARVPACLHACALHVTCTHTHSLPACPPCPAGTVGLYRQPVAVLDFASLYPSLYRWVGGEMTRLGRCGAGWRLTHREHAALPTPFPDRPPLPPCTEPPAPAAPTTCAILHCFTAPTWRACRPSRSCWRPRVRGRAGVGCCSAGLPAAPLHSASQCHNPCTLTPRRGVCEARGAPRRVAQHAGSAGAGASGAGAAGGRRQHSPLLIKTCGPSEGPFCSRPPHLTLGAHRPSPCPAPQARAATRAQLKGATDPATRAVLDCRQRALKITGEGAGGRPLPPARFLPCPATPDRLPCSTHTHTHTSPLQQLTLCTASQAPRCRRCRAS